MAVEDLEPIPMELFLQKFQSQFQVDATVVTSQSELFVELGLDSFDAFRLLIWLEVISGEPYPSNKVPPLFTLQDAYDYYIELRAGA